MQKLIKIIIIVLVFVNLLLLFSLFLVNRVPDIKNTIALATTVKTETFTELYFENHLTLPINIVPNQENKFQFTIHNLENKDMEYTYEVYLEKDGQRQDITSKYVFIPNNEYKTINQRFTLNNSYSRVKVVVNLIEKNQSIHFWMDKYVE